MKKIINKVLDWWNKTHIPPNVQEQAGALMYGSLIERCWDQHDMVGTVIFSSLALLMLILQWLKYARSQRRK